MPVELSLKILLLQFTAFIHNGQLKDMICFYDTAERKYYNIMQLGR